MSILEMGGQIAAIVICLYLFISVLLFLVVQLALAFVLSWVREKSELLKLVRLQLDVVNEASHAAMKGVAPSVNENAVARNVAKVPITLQAADKKVEQVSDRVAVGVIEFRARMVQAQTIAKAFFLPGLIKSEQRLTKREGELPLNSPDYQMIEEKQAPEMPVAAAAARNTVYNGAVEMAKAKNVPTH